MMEDRKITLLRACKELLEKQNQTMYVLNLLEQEVEYDGVICDGSCLLQDIKDELGEDE